MFSPPAPCVLGGVLAAATMQPPAGGGRSPVRRPLSPARSEISCGLDGSAAALPAQGEGAGPLRRNGWRGRRLYWLTG